MSFLFESVEGGAVRGRYSIIGLKPDLIFRVRGQRAEINRTSAHHTGSLLSLLASAAPSLARTDRRKSHRSAGRIAADGCRLFGYLGYDMVRQMERVAGTQSRSARAPPTLYWCGRPLMIVFDAVKDAITVVTPVRPQAGVSRNAAYARAAERLSRSSMLSTSRSAKSAATADHGALAVGAMSPTRHLPNIARWSLRAKEYIAAGDIFQVVLSQRFRGAVFAVAVLALSRAAAGQSGAVSLLPQFRRLRHRRLESGNSGSGA